MHGGKEHWHTAVQPLALHELCKRPIMPSTGMLSADKRSTGSLSVVRLSRGTRDPRERRYVLASVLSCHASTAAVLLTK